MVKSHPFRYSRRTSSRGFSLPGKLQSLGVYLIWCGSYSSGPAVSFAGSVNGGQETCDYIPQADSMAEALLRSWV